MSLSFPQPTSNKGRLLALMVEAATPGRRAQSRGAPTKRRGWVGMDVKALARATGISEHDVVHSLHDMREQGLVGFQTRPAGRKGGNGGDVPVRLRVTDAAYRLNAEPEPVPSPAPEPAPAPEPPLRAPEPTPAPDRYPLLADLRARDRRRAAAAQAADLLGEAGLDDLALEALAAVPDDTPLEREVLALLRDLGL